MKNEATSNDAELRQLVRALLKVDPGALAALGSRNEAGYRTTAAGLHEFMRRMLERSLSLLWAANDFQVRLHSGATVKTLGCYERIGNLIELFAWALVREPRRVRGLGELVICEADIKVVHLPRKPHTDNKRSTVDELVRMATAIFEPDFDAIRDMAGPAASSISIRDLIAETLGVRPGMLIRLYHDKGYAADNAYWRDPEGQAIAGLSAMLMRILHHHPLIRDAATDDCVVGFMVQQEGDYEGADGAAGANLGTLLTAGWFADGNRDLLFVA